MVLVSDSRVGTSSLISVIDRGLRNSLELGIDGGNLHVLFLSKCREQYSLPLVVSSLG